MAAELRNLVGGDGWNAAMSILDDMLKDISSVATLDEDRSIELIAMEAIGRKSTILFIESWKNTIDNHIANYETYLKSQREPQPEPIMINRE